MTCLQIKYTQGGQENVELARKYFAQAMKLNAHNTRAIYGFFLVRDFHLLLALQINCR